MQKLILYFSRAGENYTPDGYKMLEVGYTKQLAQLIAKKTEADLLEILPEKAYSNNYQSVVERVEREKELKARPLHKSLKKAITEYDVIFLGYPIWMGTIPLIVSALLEEAKWKGQRIYPFCTNEGSGFGHSLEDLALSAPGAQIGVGLEIVGHQVLKSEDKISAWLKQINQEESYNGKANSR